MIFVGGKNEETIEKKVDFFIVSCDSSLLPQSSFLFFLHGYINTSSRRVPIQRTLRSQFLFGRLLSEVHNFFPGANFTDPKPFGKHLPQNRYEG